MNVSLHACSTVRRLAHTGAYVEEFKLLLLRQHAPEDPEAASDIDLKRTPQNRETLSSALVCI